MTTRPHAHRRAIALLFSLALSAVTLYFVFRGVDRQVLHQLLRRQHQLLLVAGSFFILLQIGLAGERWRAVLSALLRSQSPPMRSVQAVYYSSVFFNCLPLGTLGGDLARVLLARRFHASVKQLVLSVLADRVVTVAALVLLAVATLPTIGQPLAKSLWLAGVAILLLCLFGLLLLRPIERLLGRWRHLNLILSLLRAVEELRYLSKGGGILALCYGVMSAAAAVCAGYCIARSLEIAVAPLALAACMAVMTLVVALPISAAGWGVREVSLVTLLGLVGVERAAALVFSVEFGLLSTLLCLPGGIVWLTLRPHREVAFR